MLGVGLLCTAVGVVSVPDLTPVISLGTDGINPCGSVRNNADVFAY